MIVLDASVLIAYLDGEDQHHSAAEALLSRGVDEDFGCNVLTLAEVLVGPLRCGRLDRARTALHQLEMRELSFPPDAAVRLAQLRVSTGLKMPDCAVVLATEEARGTVATLDARLARAAQERGLAIAG